MSARCPEGHLSESVDYCDVCGSPIDAAAGSGLDLGPSLPGTGSSGDGGPTPAPGQTQTCPHCGAANVEDALFCEACGYDFTTGAPPMDASAGEDATGVVPVTGPESDDAGEEPEAQEVDGEPEPEEVDEEPEPAAEPAHEPAAEADRAAEVAEPAPEPAAEADRAAEVAEPEPAPEPAAEADRATEVAEPQPEPEPAPVEPAPRAHRAPRHTPPSRELADTWVVEIWVDPDWYAVQQTDEACPSAGVPDIVLLTRSSALVGRPSGSLGVRPEIDAGGDSAVSRRHAQLSSDGQRWWIEDLGSSNGTFVGTVGESLPTTPLAPGQRVEIDRDDRIFVGAWTRLALRQATEAETQGRG